MRTKLVVVPLAIVLIVGCEEKAPVVKGPIPPGEYVILPGDDLSHVALRAYDDMKLWFTLLNANPQLTTRARFELVPGETIQIPLKANLNHSLPKSVFPKQLPADYIVMPGDSLPFIAQGCYGDKQMWLRIFEANRSSLSSVVLEKPSQLTAGQVLRIPAPPKQTASAESKL